MSKKIKLICILLCSIMLLSVFACGDGGGKPADTSGNIITGDAAPEETSVTDMLAPGDFDGYNYTILGEIMRDYYFTEEQNGEVINDAVYSRNAAVRDFYNVNLDYNLVEWKQATPIIINLTAADDNEYDLYTATHLYLGTVITGGCVQNWNAIPGVNTGSPWYVQAANETYSIGDNMMLLFGDYLESNVRNSWCMVFNKRLAENYNLPDLYDAVDSGKWTIDYLMSVTKDIYDDTDGDGRMTNADFYGFATDKFAGIDSFSRTCGLSAISKNAENYPILDFYDDNAVAAFEKLYQIYYESPGTLVFDGAFGHIEEVFAQGNAVIANTMIIFLMGDKMRDMDDDYGVLPYPKYTEEQEMGYTHLDGTFSCMMVPVTQPSSDWERTGLITESLNALGYAMVTPAIYDITLKTKLTRDEDSVRMLDLVLAGRRYSFDSLDEDNFPLSPVRAMRNLLGQRNKDIASYYASQENNALIWIEKIIDAYEGS
ncbi:MAG: hypothetical protein PHZ09_09485 [Eubacteriales bacterium]|nr:hypothetical protein [Eubacteriales bacterium]